MFQLLTNPMKRHLYFILLIGFMLLGIRGFGQTIQVGANFNAGNYGKGSSITVPISTAGVFDINQKFEIWLSDASGSFVAAQKIGEFQGFFTTFVNGTIPVGTPTGANYKIQVRATTAGVTPVNTPAFAINSNQAVVAKITSASLTELRTNEIFGRCAASTTNGVLEPKSTPFADSTSIVLKNEYTGEILLGGFLNSPFKKNYYTVTVTSQVNGVVGTRSYAIINTDNINPFQSTYTSPLCVDPNDPNSGGLTFRVNIDAGADIYKNYPGCTYEINWSDGTTNTYTLAQIIALGGNLTHKYTISSCNQSVQSNGTTYYNSFGIQTRAINPLCPTGVPTINIARVFEMPTTAMQGPGVACKGSSVTFVNKSTLGTYGNQNQPNCLANSLFYDWYVDGVKKLTNVNVNTNLVYTFNSAGIHQITLVPIDPNQNNSSLALPCPPGFVTVSICIEEVPVPEFKFDQAGTLVNSLKGCAPLTITTKNQSSTLTGCSAALYEWTLVNTTTNVSGFYTNNAIFLNGTDETSVEPKFSITNPGNYSLTLRVKNSCSPAGIIISKNITVVGTPSINNFVYTSAYCDTIPKQIDFNLHNYNPNFAPNSDVSYLWTISGGSFEFLGGTSNISANPSILFKSYGTYTIQVAYSNGCGTDTKSQTITFNQPILSVIKANGSLVDIAVCTNSIINLSGTISGPAGYSYQWLKSANAGGTLTNGPLNLTNPTATYTPVPADDDKQFTFTLRVDYPVPVPGTCSSPVDKLIKVTYTATNTAPNASIKRCTGTSVNFIPTSTISNSLFTWTVLSHGANITGYADQLSFTTNPINDILVNSGTTPQTVVYQLTPKSPQGCPGTAFTLTVTVIPSVTGNTIGANQAICIGQTPAALGQAPATNLGGGDGTFVYVWEQKVGNTAWSTAVGTANLATYQPPAITVSTDYRRKVYSPDLTTCSDISNIITITVNPLPAITVGTIPTICNTATSFEIPFSNAQNAPTKYSLVVGARIMPGFVPVTDVNFSGSPIVVTIPAGVPQATYDFVIKVRNANGCESTSQTFSLVVKAPPTVANAGTDQAKCQTGTFTLNGNTAAIGTGTWTILGLANGAVITTPSSPTSTVTGLQVGKSVTLRWTIANGPCIDSFDDVVFTNEPATTVSNAGIAQRNCSNDAFSLLANTPASNETGVWSLVSGTVTLPANLTTPALAISGVLAGQSATLRWTITNAACSSTSTVIVTNLTPLANNTISYAAPAPCAGQLITVTGTLPTGGSAVGFPGVYNYTWQYKNASGTWDDLGVSTKDLSNYTTSATITIRRVVNSYECSSTSNEITITVLPALTNTITGIQTICYNTAPTQLSGSIPSGGDGAYAYQWQSSLSAASGFTDIVGANAQNYQPGNLTSTTYFRRLVSSGTCSVFSTPVMVTVNPKSAMTGLSDKAYCANSTVNSAAFTSNPGSNTTYRWTNSNTAIGLAAGGNGNLPTFTSANTLTEPIEGIISTIPTYTANSVACDGDPGTFKIRVLPSITINPIADQVVCTGTTIPAFTPSTNATNIPAGATISYRWTISGSGVSISNGSGASLPSITANNPGTTELQAIVSLVPVYNYGGASCDGVNATYKITVKPNPSAAVAGADAKICGTSYQLNGNNPVVGTGLWTQVAGPAANITNASLYNTTVTGLQLGQHYEFQWTISNSPCSTSNSSIVKIDALSTIVNTIKVDRATVCSAEAVIFSTNVLSGGDVPPSLAASYTYTWESSPNGISSWTTIAGTGSTLTLNPTADIYVRRKVKSYGGCEVSSPAVLVTVNPSTPAAQAGLDQILCNIPQTSLAANDPGSFVGTWTDVTAGGATLTFADVHAFNTTVSGLVASKTYTLRWTIAGLNPCPDTFDEMIITVRPAITPSAAGPDQVLCDQTASTNFVTLAANTPQSFETGTWTLVSQPATSTATFANIHAPNSKLNGLIPGVYVVRWTINNDALACAATTDDIQIDVFAAPVAGALTSTTSKVCVDANSGTLSLATYIGDIAQWEYATAAGGPWTAIAHTSASYSFTNLTQTTYFRVKIISKGANVACATTVYSNTITVVVDPLSVGGTTTGAVTVCANNNTGQITLSGHVGSVLNWEYSIDNGINWLPIANTSNNLTYTNLVTTTLYRAHIKSGVCSEAFSSVSTITVLPPVTAAQVTNAELCNATSTLLDGNVPASGQGTWVQTQGPNSVVIADIHDAKSAITGLIPGTYKFTWIIANGVCAPTSATATIINYPPLVNQIQAAVTTLCAGQTAVFTDNAHAGGTGTYSYQWQTSADGITWSAPLAGQTSIGLSIVLNVSTYVRRVITSGPCSDNSNVVFITVQPPITNNTITSQTEVCIQKPVNLISGTLPTGADNNYTYQWQYKTATTPWTTIVGATGKDYQPAPLLVSTTYRRIVTSALCNGPQQSSSNETEIIVRLNAKADFSASKTVACLPFNLASVISVVPHNDVNATYEWFINGVSIGTGAAFPGYTINTDGTKVQLKLITTSKYGCDTDEKTMEFETIKFVTASFTKNKTQGCGPLTVSFSNTSTPLVGAGYEWTFGNGQISTLPTPPAIVFQPHPLNRDTTYVIRLRAFTDCQESIFIDSVLVRPQPVSIFTPNKTLGCSPLTVNFTNQSKGHPNTYVFTYGDGTSFTTTSLAAVQHTFTSAKDTVFNVQLQVTNECGTSSSTYAIRVLPNTVTANLVVNGPQLIGCQPHTVTFYNNSVGANQYTWDFGDGTPLITNAALIMTHTYTIAGTFTAKLTATNGCSTTSTTEQILVHPQPIASFATTKNNYCKDEWINFVNTSPQGDFVWDFGDGVISTLQNPQHRFVTPGVYTVTLITSVTQADGMKCSTTVTKQITVLTPPIATFATNASAFNCAPFHLIVSNNSQFADKYSWFIDGVLVSTERNPTNLWLYGSNTGVNVRLVVENTLGCTAVAAEKVEQLYPRPVADFVVLPSAIIKIPNYTFNFQNNTSGAVTAYKWTFGDGTSSTAISPTHTYKMIGQYQVNLIAFNQEGCSDTLTRQVEVQTVPGYLFVPNAFEPASQTYELKTFKPKGSGIESYRMQIFNKWGMLVWETTLIDSDGSPVEGWDGMMNGVPAPPDVYVWTIDAKFINQTIWPGMRYKSSDKPKTTGSIHLIR